MVLHARRVVVLGTAIRVPRCESGDFSCQTCQLIVQFQGDKDGLEEALEHAIKHPIGRFIREPAYMSVPGTELTIKHHG